MFLSGNWFAVAVKPRHEKSVSRSLATKEYETFVPLYKARRVFGRRVKENSLPLFPGYVFARFDGCNRLPVLITPGVNQVLGSRQGPIPIDDAEMASLRTAVKNALEATTIPFQQGQKVRVTGGPLRGVEGIVVRKRTSAAIVLAITLMQRSVQVEVEPELLLQTEKICL
jgi:transcription antitermination factor NusG